MQRQFTINTPAQAVAADASGRADVVYTVANASGLPNRAMARIVPLGETQGDWLALEGENERDFPIGGIHQFTVSAKSPAGTPSGRYSLRLDMLSARKGGEERVEGPIVQLVVPARNATPPKKSYWWIIVAILALLLIIAVAVYLKLRPTDVTDTSTTGTTGTTTTVVDTRVDVPNVISAPIAAAEFNVRQVGLNPRRQPVTDDLIAVGTVKNQRPAPATKASRGAEVVLDVVTGPNLITVPNVTFNRWDEANATLTNLGLKATFETQWGGGMMSPRRRGKVILQNPASGTNVPRGHTVHVILDGLPF